MAAPGAIKDGEPDVQRRGLRGRLPGDASTQHRSVRATVQGRLGATAAPADRYESAADRERGLAARQADRSCREERASGKARMGGFRAAGAMLTSRVTVSAAAS